MLSNLRHKFYFELALDKLALELFIVADKGGDYSLHLL